MKAASCALAASVLAATSAALATTSTSAADSSHSASPTHGRPFCPALSNEANTKNLKGKNHVISSMEKEKFAPRFDGLRFIETLVTAHR